jgi:hypothetical protein
MPRLLAAVASAGAFLLAMLAPIPAHAATTNTNRAAAAAVACARPGGSWGYQTTTVDSTPIRTGPYEACAKVGPNVPAGTWIWAYCKLTNDYGNLWYRVETYNGSHSGWAYSTHFPYNVRNNVAWC